jgi:hypothetical protein
MMNISPERAELLRLKAMSDEERLSYLLARHALMPLGSPLPPIHQVLCEP